MLPFQCTELREQNVLLLRFLRENYNLFYQGSLFSRNNAAEIKKPLSRISTDMSPWSPKTEGFATAY